VTSRQLASQAGLKHQLVILFSHMDDLFLAVCGGWRAKTTNIIPNALASQPLRACGTSPAMWLTHLVLEFMALGIIAGDSRRAFRDGEAFRRADRFCGTAFDKSVSTGRDGPPPS